jgi:hypothetical protein
MNFADRFFSCDHAEALVIDITRIESIEKGRVLMVSGVEHQITFADAKLLFKILRSLRGNKLELG